VCRNVAVLVVVVAYLVVEIGCVCVCVVRGVEEPSFHVFSFFMAKERTTGHHQTSDRAPFLE